MALRYGTDNHESEAFVRRRVAVADRHTSSAASRKTFAVAAVGVSMLAGSALLGYHASRDGSATMLRAETNTMNLDASFDPSTYDVPQFLRNQPEIVVFSGDDQSLCMDDGGARKNALSAVTVRDCRPTSVDQVFVYDDKQLMLKSAKKPDLCLSDGGATQPGDGPVHMAPCDPSSADQRFVYVDVQFRNPIKDLCLSSGGGVGTPFKMEACDPQAVDETLRILWQNEVGGPIDEYKDNEVSQSSQPMEGTTTYSEPVSPMEEAPMHTPGEGGAGVPPMEDTTFEEPVSPMEEAPIRMPGEGGAGVPPIEEAPMHMPGEGGAGVPPMEDTTFEEPVSPMEEAPIHMPGEGGAGVPPMEDTTFEEPVSPMEEAPIRTPGEGRAGVPPIEEAPMHMPGEGGAGVPPMEDTTFEEPVSPMEEAPIHMPGEGGAGVPPIEEAPMHMPGEGGAGVPPMEDATFEEPVSPMEEAPIHMPGEGGAGVPPIEEAPMHMPGEGGAGVPPMEDATFEEPVSPMEEAPIHMPGEGGAGVPPIEEAPMHMPGEGGAGVPPMEDATFEEPVSPMEEAPIHMPGEGGAGVPPIEEAPMHMPGEGGAGVPPMEDATFEEPVSPMEEAPIHMPGEGGAGVPPIEEAPMHMPGEGGAGVPPMEDTTFEEPVSSMEEGPMGRGDDAVVSPIEDAPTMSEDSEGTSTFGDPVRVAPHHITGENGAGLPPTTFSDSEPATPGHDEMTSPTLENPVDGGHVEETTYGDTIPVPVHMTGVNEAGRPPVGLLPVGDGESEPPHAADASLTALTGDWNLLAPSHATISSVNVDASADVTADEIYKYLLGVKIAAEQQYETTVSKYIRTTKCVTAGLESLAKSSLTESEYHALVDWMYEHCATTPPSTHGGGVANATDVAVDRVYMTKLEFYYKLKEHFTGPREELFGHAEGIKLRGEVGVATREKLAACIEEASARFGRDALLHSAIQWVQTECAKI